MGKTKGGGEMKTLQNIKDEVAQIKGFRSWDHLHVVLYTELGKSVEPYVEIVAKRYAAECITELREKCTTHRIGDEGEVRGMVLDVGKVDEFLFDNNLINELK